MIDPTRCAYCLAPLPGRVRFMCMRHWDALDAKQRATVARMRVEQEEHAKKLEACVAALQARGISR